MKFSEYVIIKEEYSGEGIYATFKGVLSESTNPAARAITDEQLMEVGSWLSNVGQSLKGMWGAATTAAGDVWNAFKNTPAQLAKAGQEYSTSFKMSRELAKIQDLLNAMNVVEKEVLPKIKDADEKDGLHARIHGTLHFERSPEFEQAFRLIKGTLEKYLREAKQKQAEFQAQRRDQAGVRYPAASGDASSRLPGQEGREDARRRAAEAGARSARPGAR